MSRVRVLVGTRKGAFVLTSDGKREKWDVSGPHFAGWEIYHLKGSPVDPNRIYASQTSGWFGQIIQRSDDGGKTWHQPGTPAGEPTTTPEGMPKGESNKFVYDTSPETGKPLTTHQWYDGTQHPWEFKRVWHLEPSLTDPDTVYAGVEDAALFRSTDGGKTWHELAGLRGHGTGPKWQPGAGGMGLHTILLDPTNPERIFIAISAAGAFRTDDGGKTWKPINRGLQVAVHPRPERRGRPLRPPHRDAPVAARTCCSCRCTGTSCAATTPATTGTRSAATCRPTSASRSTSTPTSRTRSTSCRSRATREHYPPEGKLRVYRSRTGGNEWEPLTKGLPQENCYVNVLRDAMAVDSLDPCGVYFGTTGGQVYASPDGGDNWAPIVRDLPAVLSVEVQTLP